MVDGGLFGHIWYWIEVHTGTVNESGPYYGFWSGFGSDIGEVVLIGAVIQAMRHLNCHDKGCWRFAHHTTANGHKLCRKHIALPNESLNLSTIHDDHKA